MLGAGTDGRAGSCGRGHNPSESEAAIMSDETDPAPAPARAMSEFPARSYGGLSVDTILVHCGLASVILGDMTEKPGLVNEATREKLTAAGMLAMDGVVPLRNGGAPPHQLSLVWPTSADFVNAVIGCLSKEGSTVAEECVRPFVHSVLCAEAAGVPWKSQYVGRRHESPRAYFTETRSDESSGPTFSGGVAARTKLAGLEARPIREQIHLTAVTDWMSEEFPYWNTDGIPASTRIPVTVGPGIREREAWADALNGIVAEYPTVPDGMFVAVSPSSEAIQIAEKVAAVNNSIDLAFGPPRDKIVLIAQGRSTLHVLSMYMMDFSMLQMEGRACVGGSDYAYYESAAPPPLGVEGISATIELHQTIQRAVRWFNGRQ